MTVLVRGVLVLVLVLVLLLLWFCFCFGFAIAFALPLVLLLLCLWFCFCFAFAFALPLVLPLVLLFFQTGSGATLERQGSGLIFIRRFGGYFYANQCVAEASVLYFLTCAREGNGFYPDH